MDQVALSSHPNRRHLLSWVAGALAAVVVAGVTGVELVSHGVLPGKLALDEIDGGCSVPAPTLSFATLGPALSGSFNSVARNRAVGYTIAYPPGRHPGDELSLIVMLHGYGATHETALVGMTPAQALALRVDGAALAPSALVTVDGGNGYWNPHPGDDPMSMVVHELIPICQRRGLGRSPQVINLMGISMGGYGALAIAERYPTLVSGVAAISPAVWTSYDQARGANAGAFASAKVFRENDVIRHASALGAIRVRVASGFDDPFRPGVEELVAALPRHSTIDIVKGCHTNPFFLFQEPPSLRFLLRS